MPRDLHATTGVAAVQVWRQTLVALRRRVTAAAGADGVALGAWVGLLLWLSAPASGSGAERAAAILAVAAAVAGGWWGRLRRAADERSLVDLLERHDPEARNLFETTREILARPGSVRPYVATRVVADAVARAAGIRVADVAPLRRSAAVLALSIAAWAIAVLVTASTPAARTTVALAADTRPDALLESVEIIVSPPAYTRRPAFHVRNPSGVDALEGSRIELAIAARADAVVVTANDEEARPSRGDDGLFRHAAGLLRTGYWTIEAVRGEVRARQLVAMVATPDDPPRVRVTAPGRDLRYPDSDRRVGVQVTATDDVALASLRVVYTKAGGSGEQFEFVEGTVPARIVEAAPASWSAVAELSLSALGVKPGDVLVYRAVVRDGRPGSLPVSSEAFFVEVGESGRATEAPLGLPADQERFALSQQMILLKTERLHAERRHTLPEIFIERSTGIATEQRAVKSAFVFLMGEHAHVEDEVAEAEQSAEILAGRLENRGVKDLQEAIAAMSTAEQLLAAGDTARALPAERVALRALQRAFDRSRYLLRSLPSHTRPDLSRRLTASLRGVQDSRGESATPIVDATAAAARSAIAGLRALLAPSGRASVGSEAGPDDARTSMAVAAGRLARQVLAVDPSSAAVRDAAARLARLAERTGPPPADDLRAIVDQVAAILVPIAGRARAQSLDRARDPLIDRLRAARSAGGRTADNRQ